MNSSSKRLLIVIVAIVGVVLLARGFDHLPGKVRSDIASERTALAAAQTQLKTERDQVAAEVNSDPDLFGSIPFGTQWQDRLDQAASGLASASHDMSDLNNLDQRNRHSDSHEAETLLSVERNLRTRAMSDAAAVQTEAAHWIDAKKHLPEQVAGMDRDYKAIHAFDLAPVVAVVQKAETDWPAKKDDLESRLNAQRAAVTQADQLWQSTADDRRKVAAGDLAGVHTGALLMAAHTLSASAAAQPRQAEELKGLTGQLYNSWDKILVDMQVRGEGNAKEYDQNIRTVRTHLTDASAKTGDTTKDEQWVKVPQSTYESTRKDLGMAIEHKSAGLYDSESEHVAQPAGFAYMAPPSQGSNQYGYWDHRGGHDFWVFYGQYALLRDLLSNHNYRPFDRNEYEDFRSYKSRGQTYYGHDDSGGGQKYGSAGSSTQERYSGSKFAQKGGFKDSQYAAKSGGYRDSHYSSPSVRQPNADHSGKSFGSGSKPPSSAPRAAPAPRGFRPAPSRPPMRSPGRSFGRRR